MTEQQNPYQAPEAAVAGQGWEDSVTLAPKHKPWMNGLCWIKEAFSIFFKCPFRWNFVFLACYVFMVIFITLLGIAVFQIIDPSSLENFSFNPLIMMAFLIPVYSLAPVFFAGFMKACDDISRGGKIKVSHIFAGLRINIVQLVLVGLLLTVMIFASSVPGILIVGVDNWLGSMSGDLEKSIQLIRSPNYWVASLLGFFLMLVVYSLYWFAPAIVILDDQKAWPAMKLSAKALVKNIDSTFIYSTGLLVILLLWFMPLALGAIFDSFILVTVGYVWFVLGLFVLPAVFIASVYTSYRSIFTEQ